MYVFTRKVTKMYLLGWFVSTPEISLHMVEVINVHFEIKNVCFEWRELMQDDMERNRYNVCEEKYNLHERPIGIHRICLHDFI